MERNSAEFPTFYNSARRIIKRLQDWTALGIAVCR